MTVNIDNVKQTDFHICMSIHIGPAVSSVGASSADPSTATNDDDEDAGERYEMVVRIP